MRRRIKLSLGSIIIAGALVLAAPMTASAATTALGGKSCTGSGSAPFVHISSTSRGTMKHVHHRTGAGHYAIATFVNATYKFRMSSFDYLTETGSYLDYSTSLLSSAIFCDAS